MWIFDNPMLDLFVGGQVLINVIVGLHRLGQLLSRAVALSIAKKQIPET
jgi:hypothetical protein